MTRARNFALLAVCIAFGAWLSLRYFGPPENTGTAGPPGPAPAFRLADTQGNYRESKEWLGKIVVVNFWATWCAPCLQEIPEFVQIQTDYADRQVQFVGIALDAPDAVMRYVDTLGINYPVLIGTGDAITVARQFGNNLGVLPYTVVIDSAGRIARVQAGLFETPDLIALLDELIPAAATPSPNNPG